jgi:CHRD domain
MKGRVKIAVAGAFVAAAAAAGAVALAGGGGFIEEDLTGYEETPLALSTTGSGEFEARVRAKSQEIRYELSYRDLEAPITQAHIHFGAVGQSGGISVWLCGNPSPTVMPPAGTQTCPAAPATITGTIRPADVIGPAGQGIAAGEFAELVAAIRAGFTYVNVHSTKYPAGEIRAQLERKKDDGQYGRGKDRGKHRG